MHNAFESKSTWDPFGVAKFDLSELLRGRKRLCLKTQIQQGPLPELLGLQTQGGEPGRMGTGQVVGNPTAVDGPGKTRSVKVFVCTSELVNVVSYYEFSSSSNSNKSAHLFGGAFEAIELYLFTFTD